MASESNAAVAEPSARLAPVEVPRRRLLLIAATFGVLIGGQLFDVVLDREDWPFAVYPMFSRILEDPSKAVTVYGTVRGSDLEVALTWPHYWPLDPLTVAHSLSRLRNGPTPEADLAEACADFYRRYEALRVAGRHTGPAIDGLRLYVSHYSLSPDSIGKPPEPRVRRYEWRPPR